MFKKLKPEFWTALVAAFLTPLAIQAFGQETQKPYPVQQHLLEVTDDAEKALDELSARTKAKTIGPYDLSKPNLGILLETKVLDEEQKLRHTIVSRVFAGTPAAQAGARAGDRLLRIGDKELDNETGKAVLMYLSDYDKEVPLTFVRDGEEFTATIAFGEVHCFQTVLRTFSSDRWLQTLQQRRTELVRIRNRIKRETTWDEERITAHSFSLRSFGSLIRSDVGSMEAELDPTRHPACRISLK